jgi:ABC-2 type transport system ATP-binding protein
VFRAELGTTVMFSTHDVGEAERYADRLLVLADGELLFTGTPAELETATGGTAAAPDFETAFVAFLRDRGH